MLAWAERNPAAAVAAVVATVTAVVALVRWALARHREYTRVMAHMAREEAEVWPSVQSAIAGQREEAMRNHRELLEKLHLHGERISKVEARMPNGELKQILATLDQLVKAKG